MSEQQLQFQGNEAMPAAGPITTSSMRRTPTNALLTLAEAKASSSTLSSNASVVLPKRGRTPGVNGVDTAEESGEGTEEGGDELGLYGNLKTALVWDCTGRRLCISARQFGETPRKLELKMKGMLDTASGQHRVWGHLRRNFFSHVPLLQRLLTAQSQRQSGGWVDEPNLDPESFLPGGLRCLLFQDWCISPGVSYDTARSPPLPPSASASGGPSGGGAGLATLLGKRVRYQLAIKKNPQMIKNGASGDLWIQARALAEFDPKASEVALGGSIRLKAVKYAITGGQDLRLSLGLDLTHDETGRMTRMPYAHISDGKLGARLQNRRWQLTYTL